MKITNIQTTQIDIHVSGGIIDIMAATLDHTTEHDYCASVSQQTYVYGGGVELGALVRVINHPRHPKTPGALRGLAEGLALAIMEMTGTDTAFIVDDRVTNRVER